jgi:hypothetical protein
MAQSRVRKWTIFVEEGEDESISRTAAPPDEQPMRRSRKTLKATRRYFGIVVKVEIP